MQVGSVDWTSPQPEDRAVQERLASEEFLSATARVPTTVLEEGENKSRLNRASEPPYTLPTVRLGHTPRSNSPPPLPAKEAMNRAITLSKKLSISNIPTQVTDSGDLMLDMHGYKSSEDEALRAEVVARKILADELEGNYDIGSLIGADEHGNLWIYSSEESKEAASRKASLAASPVLYDTASDPGYHSDERRSSIGSQPSVILSKPAQDGSELPSTGLATPPQTPPDVATAGDPNRNYAKTLRLTSQQLKALQLKPGPNLMSFSVNRATCQAYMYYWTYNVPVVISDIDGTITK